MLRVTLFSHIFLQLGLLDIMKEDENFCFKCSIISLVAFNNVHVQGSFKRKK